MQAFVESEIIEHTKAWVNNVVIGCNFCPFAAREFNTNTIRYVVLESLPVQELQKKILAELSLLDNEASIATTLLILPDQYPSFEDFLEVIADAEDVLEWENYEGIYQIASFHPLYLFEGEDPTSASHYTNRSPYPVLHILREEMVSKAIDKYPHAMEKIPEDNIKYTSEKGIAYMQQLLAQSFTKNS
jgi:uncharacterized protein